MFLVSFDSIVRGLARTQVPTTRNYTLELPTFGVIAGVNPIEVQWEGLTLRGLPSWSQLPPASGKYALQRRRSSPVVELDRLHVGVGEVFLGFRWSSRRKWAVLGDSARPRQPVAGTRQAPFPQPSSKNQFNIWATQWAAYQILSW